MTLIADRFTASATSYDEAAYIQPIVAVRLAEGLTARPRRILEIGCGTGGLSRYLLNKFPEAEFVLSDISPSMLAICQENIGGKPLYRIIDAENLPPDTGSFDLIISSLALQWVDGLAGTLKNLINILNPAGTLAFSLLGNKNFKEWQELLEKYGASSGLHDYPSAENFCWPASYKGVIRQEFLQEHHENGVAFLKSLKKIGAGTAKAGHKPISPAAMKQILKASAAGFTVSYHVLYGSLTIEAQ